MMCDLFFFFCWRAEYRGAETDHESGDRSDQLEEGGNQVQEKRALLGCPGVSQPAHVTERYSSCSLFMHTCRREPVHRQCMYVDSTMRQLTPCQTPVGVRRSSSWTGCCHCILLLDVFHSIIFNIQPACAFYSRLAYTSDDLYRKLENIFQNGVKGVK
jgi:hypothetical protein